MKKPFYKRWRVYAYTFGVIIVIGMFAPDPPEVEPEVAAEAVVEKAKPVAKVKSSEEIAAEAEAAAAKNKAEEERWLAESAAEAKKTEAAAKVKAEAVATKKAEKAAADVGVNEALLAIVGLSDGVVTDIKPSPYGNGTWETTWVIVSDAWYNSAEHEKERFAETVGDAVRLATNGEAMLVHFYDAYDKELASEKVFGGYKIKR